MNNVKAIQKLNEAELKLGPHSKKSWHDMYSQSAYVFLGGLNYDLTEGDILAIFSQYGEIMNINLVRDKKTGISKGFCFLAYEDQRSTILAVDNLNGIKVCGRTIRVDHVSEYRRPKDEHGNEIIEKGCAPKTPTPSPSPSPPPQRKKSKKIKKKKKKSKDKVRSSKIDSPEESIPDLDDVATQRLKTTDQDHYNDLKKAEPARSRSDDRTRHLAEKKSGLQSGNDYTHHERRHDDVGRLSYKASQKRGSSSRGDDETSQRRDRRDRSRSRSHERKHYSRTEVRQQKYRSRSRSRSRDHHN